MYIYAYIRVHVYVHVVCIYIYSEKTLCRITKFCCIEFVLKQFEKYLEY